MTERTAGLIQCVRRIGAGKSPDDASSKCVAAVARGYHTATADMVKDFLKEGCAKVAQIAC